jgi:hypothetical protein
MAIRITAAQEEKLEYFAALEGITIDELAEKVLTEFLDDEKRVVAAIQRAREEIKASRVLERDGVVASIERGTRG